MHWKIEDRSLGGDYMILVSRDEILSRFAGVTVNKYSPKKSTPQ